MLTIMKFPFFKRPNDVNMLSWLTLRKENRETLEKDVNRQIVNRIRLKKKMLCMEYFNFMIICLLFNVNCLFYKFFEIIFSNIVAYFQSSKIQDIKELQKLRNKQNGVNATALALGKKLSKEQARNSVS